MSEKAIQTLGLDPVALQCMRILFYPHATERTFKAIEANQQFVHYCDAAAALSMIQNQQVWMRNTTWMNDASEIRYGIDRLLEVAKAEDGVRLRDTLEAEWPGFIQSFDSTFVPWLDDFQQETYITCFTELLQDEELIGRLSMWRAYGKGNAVAFVVNGGPMLRPSDALSAYSSPVAYLTPAKFAGEFKRLVNGIVDNFDFVRGLGRDVTFNYLFAALRFSVICTKHPSFHEEREWRVVHQPNFQPSTRLQADTQVIGGAPQRIFKMPLKDVPEEGLYGVTLPDLLVRIIVGPGADSENIRREFVRFLAAAGVANAADKVVISGVPLRL